jgi:hypothetical protein
MDNSFLLSPSVSPPTTHRGAFYCRFRMLTRPLGPSCPASRDTLAIVWLGFLQCAIDLIPLISVVVLEAKSRRTAVAGSEGFSPARLPARAYLCRSNPGASSLIDWAERPMIIIILRKSSETPYKGTFVK